MTKRSQTGALEQASARVDLYRNEVESWQADHEEAMECLSFEATLKSGVDLYEFLIWLDEQVRLQMLKGDPPKDSSILAKLKHLFELWLEPCTAVEHQLRHFESKGYAVELAKSFRAKCAEARWMISPAGEAFDHPRLLEVRDAAVDEVRSGETQT